MYSTKRRFLLKFKKSLTSQSNLCVFLFIALVPFATFGQKQYEEGFVILNNQDTLYGFIKDRKSPPFGKLYKKIKFKGKRGVAKYGPKDIRSYRKGQSTFESIWVAETDQFLSQDYTSIPNSGERRFLKVVAKGYLTYYQLEFEDGESDVIDTIDLFKKRDDADLVRVTQGIFGLKRKRLIRFFNDCPPLIDKMEKKEFKYPIELANFYNKWKGAQSVN